MWCDAVQHIALIYVWSCCCCCCGGCCLPFFVLRLMFWARVKERKAMCSFFRAVFILKTESIHCTGTSARTSSLCFFILLFFFGVIFFSSLYFMSRRSAVAAYIVWMQTLRYLHKCVFLPVSADGWARRKHSVEMKISTGVCTPHHLYNQEITHSETDNDNMRRKRWYYSYSMHVRVCESMYWFGSDNGNRCVCILI